MNKILHAFPVKPLAASIAAFLLVSPLVACAEPDPITTPAASDQPETLQQVTVTASPLAEPGSELIKPWTVLSGTDLDDQRSNTVGQTIERIPGVQSSYFGAGVGRPIIRGLEGSRVAVVEDGIASLDLSGASNDHAVTIDPFLADQIEVLKGPSTLLYGSGAIGGVVNIVDGRIPEKPIDGISGRSQISYSTVDDGEQGLARVDAGNGQFAVHADYSRRFADDYDIPGGGTLLNSDTSTRSDAAGVGYTGDKAFAGVSVSSLEYHYGIPVGPSRGPIDPDVETTRIDMDQTRVDIKAGLKQPLSWLESVTLRYGHNDYEHLEHPIDDPEGTLFKNKGYEMRLEAVHSPLGAWRGAIGLQLGDRDFSAIGEETIVPNTAIKTSGLFIVEQADYNPFKIELGARYDKSSLDPDNGSKVDFDALSLSGGALWEFADHWHVALNLDRAQRAPDEEALFVHGAHDATGSFELGDPNLTMETANQADLALHYHGTDAQASIGAYVNNFKDFIYLVDTGEVEEELPVRQWSQHDAKFHGFEGEVKFKLAENDSGRWDLRAFGDTVRAELADGAGNLPRIPPARLGGSLMWKSNTWRATLGAIYYAKQDKTAPFETPTDSYTFVNAHLSYGFNTGRADWEVFVDGSNLTDQVGRASTSFLKDRAPLPGRSILVGIRNYF